MIGNSKILLMVHSTSLANLDAVNLGKPAMCGDSKQ